MSRLSDHRNLLATVIIAVVSLILSGFVAYTTSQDTDHSRITAIEVQQKNDGDSLKRIEGKVDKQGDKLDKVYEYIVGVKPKP